MSCSWERGSLLHQPVELCSKRGKGLVVYTAAWNLDALNALNKPWKERGGEIICMISFHVAFEIILNVSLRLFQLQTCVSRKTAQEKRRKTNLLRCQTCQIREADVSLLMKARVNWSNGSLPWIPTRAIRLFVSLWPSTLWRATFYWCLDGGVCFQGQTCDPTSRWLSFSQTWRRGSTSQCCHRWS